MSVLFKSGEKKTWNYYVLKPISKTILFLVYYLGILNTFKVFNIIPIIFDIHIEILECNNLAKN